MDTCGHTSVRALGVQSALRILRQSAASAADGVDARPRSPAELADAWEELLWLRFDALRACKAGDGKDAAVSAPCVCASWHSVGGGGGSARLAAASRRSPVFGDVEADAVLDAVVRPQSHASLHILCEESRRRAPSGDAAQRCVPIYAEAPLRLRLAAEG
jgi:hypothetical protein